MSYYVDNSNESHIVKAFGGGDVATAGGISTDLSNVAAPKPSKRMQAVPAAKPAGHTVQVPAPKSAELHAATAAPAAVPSPTSLLQRERQQQAEEQHMQMQQMQQQQQQQYQQRKISPQEAGATLQRLQSLGQQMHAVQQQPAMPQHKDLIDRMNALMDMLQQCVSEMKQHIAPDAEARQQSPPPPPMQTGGMSDVGVDEVIHGLTSRPPATIAPVAQTPAQVQQFNQQRQQQQGARGASGRGQQWLQQQQSSGVILCFVEFKRGRVKRFEALSFIEPGNYVIVDGDRGQDCGLAVHTCIRQADGSLSRSETLDGVNIDLAKIKPETGRVLRVAEPREMDMLHGEIATMERYALKTCRDRVVQMGMTMDVVDCEFQFDRKKVTFFFDAPEAVDFRDLTKDLFKTFGSRIWLENINTKVKNVVPDGALSHADKLLYAERGIRPPRR
jgi:hypothetical protein